MKRKRDSSSSSDANKARSQKCTSPASPSESSLDPCFAAAARAIGTANSLILLCGAGMSADSGFPVYAALTKGDLRALIEENGGCSSSLTEAQLDYYFISSYRCLEKHPLEFWAFWKGCEQMYRRTKAHEGYGIVKKWRTTLGRDNFYVFTSNVDGHFLRFFKPNEVRECHGSVRRFQCKWLCEEKLYRSAYPKSLHQQTMEQLARETKCLLCSVPGAARPAVCLYNDRDWLDDEHQKKRYQKWQQKLTRLLRKEQKRGALCESGNAHSQSVGAQHTLVLLEIGAGRVINTVRRETERLIRKFHSMPGVTVKLVRITTNRLDAALSPSLEVYFPRSCAPDDSPNHYIPLVATAVEALCKLDELIKMQKQAETNPAPRKLTNC